MPTLRCELENPVRSWNTGKRTSYDTNWDRLSGLGIDRGKETIEEYDPKKDVRKRVLKAIGSKKMRCKVHNTIRWVRVDWGNYFWDKELGLWCTKCGWVWYIPNPLKGANP